MNKKIPFGTISVTEKSKKIISDILVSNRLSSGKYVRRFEKEFANNYQTILRQSSNVKVMAQIDNPTLLPDLTVIPKKYTTAARNLAHGKKVNLL